MVYQRRSWQRQIVRPVVWNPRYSIISHRRHNHKRYRTQNHGIGAAYLWLLTSGPQLLWTCLCMLCEILCLSLSLKHMHTYTHTYPPSLWFCVWVCACVCDKPHWWSRLAVFPDWAALDMHTSKALQVDVLALQHCNSLLWLTQNTLETEKQNPHSDQCYITKKQQCNYIYCTACVCVCVSPICWPACIICLYVCVYSPILTVHLSYYHLHYLKLW